MRYHIDTIPVWDAARLDGECLFCALRRKAELDETDRFLGASVMEPDVRIRVNDIGFCAKHQVMLWHGNNRLGHSLMLQTHLEETRKKLTKLREGIEKETKAAAQASGLAKLTGKRSFADAMGERADELQKATGGCVVCERMEETIRRYVHTFFHLYKTDTEFRRRFDEGKGVCLPDLTMLLRYAPQELPINEAAAFIDALLACEEKNLTRTQEDIDWFIRKYDYRFDNEPWKNSRDATERTVNKLRGWCVGDEPNPKEK